MMEFLKSIPGMVAVFCIATVPVICVLAGGKKRRRRRAMRKGRYVLPDRLPCHAWPLLVLSASGLPAKRPLWEMGIDLDALAAMAIAFVAVALMAIGLVVAVWVVKQAFAVTAHATWLGWKWLGEPRPRLDRWLNLLLGAGAAAVAVLAAGQHSELWMYGTAGGLMIAAGSVGIWLHLRGGRELRRFRRTLIKWVARSGPMMTRGRLTKSWIFYPLSRMGVGIECKLRLLSAAGEEALIKLPAAEERPRTPLQEFADFMAGQHLRPSAPNAGAYSTPEDRANAPVPHVGHCLCAECRAPGTPRALAADPALERLRQFEDPPRLMDQNWAHFLTGLKTEIGHAASAVNAAQQHLSVEDYGDSLSGAETRLVQALLTIDGLLRRIGDNKVDGGDWNTPLKRPNADERSRLMA
jgi:hypothetical protein